MIIPSSVTVVIYIASFLVLCYQYYKRDIPAFDFGLHFWLIVAALVLMLTSIFVSEGWIPLALFALSLVWLGVSLYLFRRMWRAD